MKVSNFLLGPGSSVLYFLLGIFILIFNIQYKITDPLTFIRFMYVIGFSYIFLQGLQVLRIRSQGVSQGAMDIFFSILPLMVIIVSIVINFPKNLDQFWEVVIYSLPVIMDLILFTPMTLRIFRLTSEVQLDK